MGEHGQRRPWTRWLLCLGLVGCQGTPWTGAGSTSLVMDVGTETGLVDGTLVFDVSVPEGQWALRMNLRWSQASFINEQPDDRRAVAEVQVGGLETGVPQAPIECFQSAECTNGSWRTSVTVSCNPGRYEWTCTETLSVPIRFIPGPGQTRLRLIAAGAIDGRGPGCFATTPSNLDIAVRAISFPQIPYAAPDTDDEDAGRDSDASTDSGGLSG